MTARRWLDRRVGLPLVAALLAVVVIAMMAAGPGTSTDLPGPDDPAAPATPTPSPAASPTPEPAHASDGVFVMWARGGLPFDIAVRAAALEEVEAASFAVTDTVGLLDSRDAAGASTADWPDGYRVPMSVAAVVPDAYGRTLTDPHARAAFPQFGPGEVVLSRTAAERRHLDVGGQIDLDGREGLEVVAVLPDAALRATEVLVHLEDAAALGLPETGSLVVRHRAAPGAAAALADTLEALAPADIPARVVGGGVDGGRHSAPLVLALTERKALFGEFAYRPGAGREITVDPAWVDEHIVVEPMPIVGNVRCHRDIMDDLRAALDEIVAAGHGGWFDPAAYGGCYYPRRISAHRDLLSSHSWGIAIDLNVDMSMPGLGPVPPEEIIAIFGRHSFRWGGDFIHPDNHHWEWLGPAAQDRPDDPETGQ